MPTVKFTKQLGKSGMKDIAVATGTAEAQQETMSLNIDYNKMTKGQVLTELEAIVHKIHATRWPPL